MRLFVKSDTVSVGRRKCKRRRETEDYIAGSQGGMVDPFLNVGDRKTVVLKRGCKTGLPHVRKTKFRGIPVNVELDRGMIAEGKEPDGKPWRVRYEYPYGEIKATEGRDEDPVDVYLGPNPKADRVFVVHQVHKDGSYDEDKCFLGFDSPKEATKCYFDHGPRWGFGSLESMTFEEFKNGYLAASRSNVREKSLILDLRASFKE